ncbi:helix-turn-helix domain-containing protein [Micromonospora sp. CPCC 205539]|uniref:AraC-like ligand-binding domain-containing protein n=1 Tax=Micromonospora sp. CPCC 205539 TaxID=3122408 RepID=UPI002FEEDA0B
MLPSVEIDTKLLPPSDRFEFWHDLVSRETAPAHISSPHMDNFLAYVRAIDLGAVTMQSLRYPSLDSTRSARLVRQSAPEYYQLALPTVGESRLIQDRRETAVKASEFTFLDTARPHVASQAAGERKLAETITVMIPHSALPLSPDQVRRLLASSIPANEGFGALLAQFLRRVGAHPEQHQPAEALRLGGIVLDLVSATLARQLDVEQALPAEVRRHALRVRVLAFIEQNLPDRELTPSSVAGAHHISLRTLNRLFEGESMTVAEIIRHRRLDRCQRDLTSPLAAHQPIYVIAARWGFPDKAHFTRLFRSTYGLSPQQYRSETPVLGSSDPLRAQQRGFGPAAS